MTYLLAAWKFLPDSIKKIGGMALVVALLAYGAVFAHDRHDARIAKVASKATRDSIYGAAKDVRDMVWPAERARWQRTEDSLRLALSKRDTALVGRIQTVRRLVMAIDTVRDTVRMTAKIIDWQTEPVRGDTLARACSALANDCEAFRATANRAFAVADSLRRADTTAIRALSVGLVDARESFARAVKWKKTERVLWAGLALGCVAREATR